MQSSRYNIILNGPEKDQFIIFNPLSGAMDIFNSHAVKLLNLASDKAINETFQDFFAHCKMSGYIYSDYQEEQKELENVEKKLNELHSREPLSIALYVTYLCNLHCTYCFQSDSAHSKVDVLTPEMIDSMFETISDFQKRKENFRKPDITIVGGEPLLAGSRYQSAVQKILQLCSKNEYNAQIITNGTNLYGYSEMLSHYPVKFVQVTLDGIEEVHDKRRVFSDGTGSFQKIITGVDQALDKGIHIEIRINVDRKTIDNLPDLGDFITDKGWLEKGIGVHIHFVNEFGSECCTPEKKACPERECDTSILNFSSLNKLLQMVSEKKQTSFMRIDNPLVRYFECISGERSLPRPSFKFCPATKGNQISLDPFGNIFSCCCMNACELEVFKLGSYFPKLCWNENIFRTFANRSVTSLSLCKKCSLALLCGGGCTRLVLKQHKDLKNDSVCPPMVDMSYLQVLANHFWPKIVKNEKR
jgi:uncharacterized protein